MADKYIRAGALAEQFRDMAEFADEVQAVALREAAAFFRAILERTATGSAWKTRFRFTSRSFLRTVK